MREDLSLKNVKQFKIGCRGDQHKLEVIDAIYEVCANLKQTIVFCQRTNTAQALAQYMRKQKYRNSQTHALSLTKHSLILLICCSGIPFRCCMAVTRARAA